MNDEEAFLSYITTAPGSKITKLYDIRSSRDYKARLDEYPEVEGLFDVKVEADDACVMIYTSGSTGKPNSFDDEIKKVYDAVYRPAVEED